MKTAQVFIPLIRFLQQILLSRSDLIPLIYTFLFISISVCLSYSQVIVVFISHKRSDALLIVVLFLLLLIFFLH